MGICDNRLSVWADTITPSPTLAVTAKAKALKAAGEDICGFGAGEPDFDTPDFIKKACSAALYAGHTKYIETAGLPALREALAAKYVSVNGISGVTTENVVVSPGGKFSCYLAIQATCGPGDEVILPAPYWVSYPEMIKLAGATPKVITTSDKTGFKITPPQLESAVTERTRLFILNSPSNPTGVVYTKSELEEIMAVVLRLGILILSDEIYESLLYDNTTHHSPASFSKEAAASTMTVGGFSKTFSMTGWRLGVLVAPPKIAQAVASMQSHTTSNATTFVQFGALAVLQKPEEARKAIEVMVRVFDQRRRKIIEGLAALPKMSCVRAQGAFYLFPNISKLGLSSTDFASCLLDEQKVAVVPGIGFGDDTCVRLSYATSDETIKKGLDRIKTFYQQLIRRGVNIQ